MSALSLQVSSLRLTWSRRGKLLSWIWRSNALSSCMGSQGASVEGSTACRATEVVTVIVASVAVDVMMVAHAADVSAACFEHVHCTWRRRHLSTPVTLLSLITITLDVSMNLNKTRLAGRMSTIRDILLFDSQVCDFGEEAMLGTQRKLFMVQYDPITHSSWWNSINGCAILELVSTSRDNSAWNCHLSGWRIRILVLSIWSLSNTSSGTLTCSLLRDLWEDSQCLSRLCPSCNAVICLLVLLLW